ncbi:ABC transporter permease [Labrenzia sp. CE80]|uniref:ABC transporter permease n=1 Tax=Labrenzia sp. CE80 TaxID=1788986 RepID=UPI00129A27E2|nr:ABC transporter permease [Labrenzia sp. CE80]
MPLFGNEDVKAAVADRTPEASTEPRRSSMSAFLDSDIFHSFLRSKVTVAAALGTAALFLLAFLAPWISPHDPFDLATLSIMDARVPPVWMEYADPRFVLGTDDQGRDLLSGIFYGMRISLIVGFCSVIAAAVLGISLGLVAGYMGGRVDAVIMRIADIQLTFPAILIALLVDGAARGIFGGIDREVFSFWILIFSLALSFWVQYARTVRGSTMVEKNKEYVQAARVIGIPSVIIMVRHILPNVTGPVLVIATINLALAIVTEATLSFLGVGMPPTQPSLGTLISIGNDFLYSGEWWIAIFPGLALALLVLNVNLLGDWLRDALNPKLR